MWERTLNLNRGFELEIRETLNRLEQDWLIGRLATKPGVHSARLFNGEILRLVVEYDPDLLNGSDVMDFLQACGLHARPAPVRRGGVPISGRHPPLS